MDPLAQLSDIHLPANIHSYPIAPGWWVLLAFVLLAITILIKQIIAYRAKRKIQKQLLVSLKNDMSTEALSQLLKYALISYFPRQQTASLFGENLQLFLHQQLPEKKQNTFNELSSNCFDNLYQRQNNSDTNNSTAQYKQAVEYWVRHALPPLKRHYQGGK